jgi:DNA-binding transcriptional MerR regulator
MIRIGDFARLARVSVRALRHYEATGLLSPAHVDARSRYRYYDAEQLTVLERLLLLKDLGLPLATIRTLLAAPPAEFRSAISKHRAVLSRQIEEQKRTLERVGALEAWLASEGASSIGKISGGAGDGIIRTKSFPSMRALCIRAHIDPASTAITDMFEATERRAHRSRTDQPPLLLLHNAPTSVRRVDAEVCVPVASACRLSGVREIEAEPMAASITYRGPYAGTDDLYARMREWLSRQNLVLAKRPVREIYHRFGADQMGYRLPAHRLSKSSQGFITELAIPVSEKRK